MIDNALYGARLIYDLGENWQIKGFSGRQRFLFSQYEPILSGGSLEGYIDLSSEEKNFTLAPGVGLVNRTLDEETMGRVIDIVKNYQDVDQFIPEYNTYAASIFNTLTAGRISWYAEAAFKSSEAFFDPNAIKTEASGAKTFGKMVKES